MKPVINLEENIGKTVGRRRPIDPLPVRATDIADAKAWRKAFGLETGGPCDARVIDDGKGSLLLTPRPTARRGTKGLLSHLRQQTVSFPTVERHTLPGK